MFLCSISAWFLWRVSVTIENGCCSIVATFSTLNSGGASVDSRDSARTHRQTHRQTHTYKHTHTNTQEQVFEHEHTHMNTHTRWSKSKSTSSTCPNARDKEQFWQVIACSVLQRVDVCCSVLQYFAVCRYETQHDNAVLARYRL